MADGDKLVTLDGLKAVYDVLAEKDANAIATAMAVKGGNASLTWEAGNVVANYTYPNRGKNGTQDFTNNGYIRTFGYVPALKSRIHFGWNSALNRVYAIFYDKSFSYIGYAEIQSGNSRIYYYQPDGTNEYIANYPSFEYIDLFSGTAWVRFSVQFATGSIPADVATAAGMMDVVTGSAVADNAAAIAVNTNDIKANGYIHITDPKQLNWVIRAQTSVSTGEIAGGIDQYITMARPLFARAGSTVSPDTTGGYRCGMAIYTKSADGKYTFSSAKSLNEMDSGWTAPSDCYISINVRKTANSQVADTGYIDHVNLNIWSDSVYDLAYDKFSANQEPDLLFWGDSMTAGASTTTTIASACASELGRTYLNCGVGGESANTIAARQGGNSIIIPAGDVNDTYNDGFTDVFGGTVQPIRQTGGASSGAVLYINGQECTLSVQQTSSSSDDAVYTISGYAGSATTVPKMGRFLGSKYTGKVVIIWVGQNGSTFGIETGVDARMTIIDSMIAHIPHKRYVVIGMSSGNDSTRDDDDAAMLAHYGNQFLPIRKLMVRDGLTIAGITATEQDTTDIGNGKVPTSLRLATDNLHYNNSGNTVAGKLLADKIRALGYFD